jgi:hypothetical protein
VSTRWSGFRWTISVKMFDPVLRPYLPTVFAPENNRGLTKRNNPLKNEAMPWPLCTVQLAVCTGRILPPPPLFQRNTGVRPAATKQEVWHRLFVCLFVVYLTTLFQYLRLYSVNFYSILIRLPSSSEAGETRVRNMAAEFCRRAPVLVGFFNMP